MIRRIAPLLVVLAALGCRGGPGASCERSDDCRSGLRCELNQCVGAESSACGYLRACLRRASGRVNGMLGPRLVQMLDSHPDEEACRQRLRLLASTGQGDALRQLCGPRVQ